MRNLEALLMGDLPGKLLNKIKKGSNVSGCLGKWLAELALWVGRFCLLPEVQRDCAGWCFANS